VDSILVERRRFGGQSEIPALMMSPRGRAEAPVVVYQHGYTGRKENDLGNLLPLAERGYRTVSLDARLHGERRPADFAERFERDFAGIFHQVVMDTAADLSVVLNELGVTKAGFIGVSMGAYIAYRALVDEPRLAAVVPFIGSPGWQPELPQRVPELARALQERRGGSGPDALPALLIMNGQQDELVSPEGATMLHQALLPVYADAPARLEYHLDPALGHAVTEPMWRAAVEWIARFL
jgi:fermentation-respiration switch protein FrsA (DUF1100 family)